jgi:pilus assembly protein Flp/PilA
MRSILTALSTFSRDESGVTAIEYGMIAGLIVVGLIVIVGDVGVKLVNTFTAINTALPVAP